MAANNFGLFCCVVLLVGTTGVLGSDDDSPVTCGSVVKVVHKETGYRLHSHSINWGSGSGQQSVTANADKTDTASLWIVKEGHNNVGCGIGERVACGSRVRLEHVNTQKNLHSHNFPSPLTRVQEVSAYGENGFGDTGDTWIVECDGREWSRGGDVRFKHVDTSKYLSSGSQARFTQQNCPNCPIIGQQEVACDRQTQKSVWRTDEGIYFSP